MTTLPIYGYAPRKHGLYGFGYTTDYYYGVQTSTLYCGYEAPPMAIPPHAMPHGFDAKCDYCGVEQMLTEVGLCTCCGAPL